MGEGQNLQTLWHNSVSIWYFKSALKFDNNGTIFFFFSRKLSCFAVNAPPLLLCTVTPDSLMILQMKLTAENWMENQVVRLTQVTEHMLKLCIHPQINSASLCVTFRWKMSAWQILQSTRHLKMYCYKKKNKPIHNQQHDKYLHFPQSVFAVSVWPQWKAVKNCIVHMQIMYLTLCKQFMANMLKWLLKLQTL